MSVQKRENRNMNNTAENGTDAYDEYADIINMQHHVSQNHPQMPILDRAAQFGSFAALRGYDAAVEKVVEQSVAESEFT